MSDKTTLGADEVAGEGLSDWTFEDDALMKVFGSPDAFEGPRAFAEKREPVWRDE